MKSMRGLMHTTSVETTHDPRTTFATTSAAGHKRSLSSIQDDHKTISSPARTTVQFQRSISLPNAPPRISPSRIVNLDERAAPSEYSQRRLIAATPTASRDPELALDHPTYGLPQQLVDNFASLGIKQIYPWQKSCLKGPGLLTGEKNLVYCAPTGGGKSLVADVLMLKRILEEQGSKALLVLPYVALVQEKVRWLRSVVQGLRFATAPDIDDEKRIWRRRADEGTVRVVGFFGGGKVRATWADFDIGVCTLEKANALVNTAIDDCSISKLRAVILDELHMVDDDHRGYLLELVATKLLSLEQPVQIVGMSATLPNMDLMAQWLDGHCYETRYRPVPIEEHLVYDRNVYPAGSTSSLIKTAAQLNGKPTSTQGLSRPTRRIELSTHKELRDPVLNAVVTLAYETAASGFGALVFAGSRGMCESDARWISRAMPSPHELDPELVEKRLDLLGDLRSLNTGIDPVLEETVLYGVAFHLQEFGVMVNWQVFRNEMEGLDESALRVLRLLGIKPTTILKLAQGATLRETTPEEKQIARVHRRFYLALQLRDLCNEVPIHIVSRKYDVPRGTVQNLSQTCQGFAAGMIKFCEKMGWGVMAAALDHFQDRLVAGAKADLLALAKIPFIKSRTAFRQQDLE
ncbi:hypothetical protein ACJ41O_004377 [Fusarium nematophilum]